MYVLRLLVVCYACKTVRVFLSPHKNARIILNFGEGAVCFNTEGRTEFVAEVFTSECVSILIRATVVEVLSDTL